MEGDGKPVRLVADALHQEERFRVERQPDRLALAGPEEFFVLFGQAEGRHRGQPHRFHHLARRRQLALAAVDQHQVR